MRLDRVRFHKGRRGSEATKAFADGPAAIVRVEQVVRPDDQGKQLGMLKPEDAAWSVQTTAERIRALINSTDAVVASGATYSALVDRAGIQAGVTPGFEIKVRDPVMFIVSLKEAGVEKARAEAKARPGARRA